MTVGPLLAGLAGLVVAAHAQEPFSAGTDVGSVIATAVELSPDMERGRLAIEDGAGARVVAAAPFDLQVRAWLHGGRQSLPLGGGAGALVAADSLTTTASAVKAFRSGVVVSSEISLGRLRVAGISSAASQADSSVSVLVPLAGGRGGGAATGAERAAERSYRGAVLDREHISSRAVLDAVVAYWRYAAAYERLRTYGESTARAQRLVEETEALIGAEERPASDRDVMASNLASKRTTETAAGETLRDARYALGLSMGLAADAIPGLGPPVTGFPSLPDGARDAVVDVASRESAIRTATTARRDLVAARARRDGARLAWEGALRDLPSRWDLVAGVGHTSTSPGSGSGSSGAPLVQGAGVNGLVQVVYEPAATNSAVQGRALRLEASYRMAALAADDLVRHIRANAVAAVEALHNASREVRDADEAVRLSQRTVETEQQKFQLGLATLFDAILAEDALTNARLRRTDARFRYAVALARLRFETGTLLDSTSGVVSVDPATVTSLVLKEQDDE